MLMAIAQDKEVAVESNDGYQYEIVKMEMVIVIHLMEM